MAKISLLGIIFNQWQALANFYLFLPHYFNVKTHLLHLFSPWKRLVGSRKEKGFSWEDYLNVISMNMVSSSIGFMMRSLVLLLFFLTALGLLILTPIWLILGFIIAPFQYLLSQLYPYEARKNRLKKRFIIDHALESENTSNVANWFDQAYAAQQQAKNSFSLANLLSIPAIGRDWHYGFTPTLEDFSDDLTSPLTYKTILLDREEEIAKIELAFAKSQNANVLLVGTEGVGKHTIVDGLAQRIYAGKARTILTNYRLIELNMEKVLSTKPSYEEKVAFLEELLKEASIAKNIIVVITDFHKYITSNLVGDFSSVWAKFASLPKVRLLGITTPFYFEQLIFRNDKLQSLFNKVLIEEPPKQKVLAIMLEKALLLEKHYRLIITYEAVLQIINRCQYYVTHIPFPEKAINLLDEVCLKAKDRVTPELVDEVLQEKTKLPVGKLGAHLKHKLLYLEKLLSEKISGQDAAIAEIGKAIRRSYIEERRKKPLVSMLFLGPTGVGKTETAKQLAKIFFNSSENLLRFDMSFYQNKQDLEDLLGSLSRQESGLLASAIREKPYSVLLIDEIEKAHKDILNVFLTLLDEGYLVDGYGVRVDAKNLMVIATSNALSKQVLGWVQEGKNMAVIETLVREQVIEQGIFTPEWLNRFDKLLIFAPLSLKATYEIGYKIARQVIQKYLEQKKVQIVVTPEELKSWIEGVYKPENGAREVDRVIRENIANKASDLLLT